MTQFLRPALMLCSLLFSVAAFSLSLHDAKNQGLVGEQPNGYLGIVGQSGREVVTLVEDINAKRRAAYEQIASSNNTPLEAVEKLAGKKAIEKTASGQYISVGGRWQKVP